MNETENPYPPFGGEGKPNGTTRSFVTGLVIGLLTATLVTVIAFLLWMRFGNTGGASYALADESDLLDAATIDKLRLLNNTIDLYYYKDDEVDMDARRDGLYTGLLDSLGDPYSVYYTEEDRAEQSQQMSGIYYGIGAYVSMHKERNRVYISGVIPSSPAEGAGLKENDIIWEVDGVSTAGMNTDQVVSLIRGPEGTEVVLTILRDAEELSFPITRARVESQTVTYEMLEGNAGYLYIREFDTVTTSQFENAMNALYAEGMEGLILDLRSNPGGSLAAVCEIAQMLLPEGEIVYTLDKNGVRESYTSDGSKEIQIPLVVLVNGNSASASEILAGAIKDYGKGTLVGTQTYGKGIVQRIFDFEDNTGVKLTVSDYYTPAGHNIHGIGIEPDITIEYDADAYAADETDNQLEKAKEVLLGKMN